MSDIQPRPPDGFDLEVETLIIGGGAAGMVAALSAKEAGQEVLVIEADALATGSTALSAGLIPAAGTEIQKAAGIKDDAATFAADIQRKARDENDPALVQAMTETIAPTVDWLHTKHGLQFSLLSDFDYPGHSRRRMHGLPSRSGAELMDALRTACEKSGIDIICERRATTLFHDDIRILGLAAARPDGGVETIGCTKLILACNGFGGNRQMVTANMPEIDQALWFGHDSNQGEAVQWGQALGAATRHLGAYQGHGNVAHPHGILITWAVITEGGIQVNNAGERFWDESQGYSEAAQAVLSQPDGKAFAIFDDRIASVARQFDDFKHAEEQGAIRIADTLPELAAKLGLPADALQNTVESIPQGATDAFGRRFDKPPLAPPDPGNGLTQQFQVGSRFNYAAAHQGQFVIIGSNV